jgi:hypothetical protein
MRYQTALHPDILNSLGFLTFWKPMRKGAGSVIGTERNRWNLYGTGKPRKGPRLFPRRSNSSAPAPQASIHSPWAVSRRFRSPEGQHDRNKRSKGNHASGEACYGQGIVAVSAVHGFLPLVHPKNGQRANGTRVTAWIPRNRFRIVHWATVNSQECTADPWPLHRR